MQIKALEDIFKIKIDDKTLFKKAITHSSFTKENNIDSLENYERLEFFGDAVLKLYVSKILYEKYPKSDEGQLSKIRSIVLSDTILSEIANNIGLKKCLILGKNAEKSGERNRESIIACTMEALIGAFYLDNKQEAIFNFLKLQMEDKIIDVKKNFAKYNAKELLQEYTQGKTKELPKYNLVREFGIKHKPQFEIEVIYQEKVLACEIGKSKKEAEQKCAYMACIQLGVIDGK